MFKLFISFWPRRQDSSIGFGAPVRTNMRIGGLTNAIVTSSLLESVRTKTLSSFFFVLVTHKFAFV